MNEQPITNPAHTPPPQQPNQQSSPQVSSKTDVLGIISIVFIFVAPLVGLILGLIGRSKAKKEGYSPTLSNIGWIINLVLVIIGTLVVMILFLSLPALQRNSRDVSRKNDLNVLAAELNQYAANNEGYYPASLTELRASSLIVNTTDVSGVAYTYVALPRGCTNKCTAYEISTELETSGEVYTISSND